MPRTAQPMQRNPSRRADKPSAPYQEYYDLVFRAYADDDKVSRKDNTQLREFSQVHKSDDLFGVFQAGVVMVDVDDGNNANIIQRMLDDCGVSYLYQKTTRGLHFFFYHGKWSKVLRDRSHIVAAVGLEVDYKCYSVDGTKLSKTLEDGTVQPRPLLTSPNWNGDLLDLPHFLVPVHAQEDFRELRDCRNEHFYIYILKLLRYGLDNEQTKHTIRLINNYVLPSALSDRELNIILRDESFPTENEIFIYSNDPKKTAKLDYELFANHLIEKHHIIKIDAKLYVYDDGVYVMLDTDKLNELVMCKLKNTTKNMRGELNAYIFNFAPVKQQSSYNYILFKNCIYDIVHRHTLPITPDYIFLNRIDHNYNPDAPVVPVVDTVFNNLSCGDEEVKSLLQEIIGYTFYRRNKLRKFFVLVGDGFNGKSTYLDMIENLLSASNVARVDLQELVTDKFAPQLLTDKLVDLGDDIDKEFVANTGRFKKLVTGETIIAQKKGQDQFNMTYYGKFIFSCNDIPRINDRTYGMKSRMVIVPLKADFSKQEKIPFIDELLQHQDAMEYILKLAMNSLINLLDSNSFTLPQSVVAATEEYHKDNDSVELWLEEFGEVDQKVIQEVYLSYNCYCQESGMRAESKITFCKRFWKSGYEKKQVKESTGDSRKSKYIFSKMSSSISDDDDLTCI